MGRRRKEMPQNRKNSPVNWGKSKGGRKNIRKKLAKKKKKKTHEKHEGLKEEREDYTRAKVTSLTHRAEALGIAPLSPPCSSTLGKNGNQTLGFPRSEKNSRAQPAKDRKLKAPSTLIDI